VVRRAPRDAPQQLRGILEIPGDAPASGAFCSRRNHSGQSTVPSPETTAPVTSPSLVSLFAKASELRE
jgi:hypothetical protein